MFRARILYSSNIKLFKIIFIFVVCVQGIGHLFINKQTMQWLQNWNIDSDIDNEQFIQITNSSAFRWQILQLSDDKFFSSQWYSRFIHNIKHLQPFAILSPIKPPRNRIFMIENISEDFLPADALKTKWNHLILMIRFSTLIKGKSNWSQELVA